MAASTTSPSARRRAAMATSVEQPAWERMVRVSAGSTPAATDSISTAEGSGRDRLGLPPAAEAAGVAEDNVDVAVAVDAEVGVSASISTPCNPQRKSAHSRNQTQKYKGRTRRRRVSVAILRALGWTTRGRVSLAILRASLGCPRGGGESTHV